MKTTLYVVNGPSGAGKSHLLRYVETRFDGARAIAKLTTRPQRPAEAAQTWSDLIHVSDERFRELNPEFRYRWNGFHYGIGRADLSDRLDGARLGVVVIRDTRTIRDLATGFPGGDVVVVLVTASPSTRRERLIAEGLSEREISRRLVRDDEPAADDRSDSGLYHWRLENDSSPEEYHRKISEMIAGGSGD